MKCGVRSVECEDFASSLAAKQDGNHEPESIHVLRRWIDHNKMTVHYSAFFCDRKRRSQK